MQKGIIMKISTKGRYALRMLVDLAQHDKEEYVALKERAEKQNISKKYRKQRVPTLTRGGTLPTNRGYQGGYRLSRDASSISCGEVLRLTEGSLSPIVCIDDVTGDVDCDRKADCMTLPLWIGLTKVINKYLNGISIQDIIDEHNDLGGDAYMI